MERLEARLSKMDKLEAKLNRMDKLEALLAKEQQSRQDLETSRLDRQLQPIKSNITNIYTKIKALREADGKKCSIQKCEVTREKTKKMNQKLTEVADQVTKISQIPNAVKTTVDFLEAKTTALETRIAALEPKVSSLEPAVTANKNDITKINNCFSDINSADCPTSRIRHDLDDDHLSKSPKLFSSRQSTTPLVPELKSLVTCMTDSSDASCSSKYAATSSIPNKISSIASDISTLNTDVPPLKSCMTNPTLSGIDCSDFNIKILDVRK